MSWLAPLIPTDPQKLILLDILLHGLHLAVILFVITGWIFPYTRKAHLIMLGIVWFSWLVLGIAVGNPGYCVLTDWQWQVKHALGETHLPPSYLDYLYWRLTGRDIDNTLMAWSVASVLIICTLLCLRRPTKRYFSDGF